MRYFFEKLYKDSKDDFLSLVKKNLTDNGKMFIVTANPEAFMFGEKDE